MTRAWLVLLCIASSSAFSLSPLFLPRFCKAGSTSCHVSARANSFHGVIQRQHQPQAAAVALKMIDQITKVKEGDSLMAEVTKKLGNTGFWSCPPSVCTMYTDDPEYFEIVQGRVEITKCTIQGKLIGEGVQFGEGEFGIVPAGAYKWEIIRPTTKQTSCREGLQLTTKGWREEPPIKALRGKGTLSTNGRNAEDDLKYLKELIAEKGAIPQNAWETAIAYKLDRDIYLANISFKITDKGVLCMDRVSEKVLDVFNETGFVGYDPNLDYIETEASKRWRKDGTFEKNAMFRD